MVNHPLSSYLLLAGAGLVAGVLNVVAGGGSFLTLPALLYCGLPASFANATNRVGVVMQNLGAVWSFRRHGVLAARWALAAAVPACAGALVGVWLALRISDDALRRVLAVLMVVISLWSLFAPQPRTAAANQPTAHPWLVAAGFLVAGLYTGFIQAGVGFLVLAVTSFAGFDLVRGNAIKVAVILIATALSLALFAAEGKVDWLAGLALGTGNLLGGLAGARLTVLKGHRWIRSVVTVAVIAVAVRLWLP